MHTRDGRPWMMLIAGFGDNAGMYERLADTELGRSFRLDPFNMPGFGAPRLEGETTLNSLADAVADRAASVNAGVIVAHSVASIIASLAAGKKTCPLRRIVSLEGNITPDDAYFSGTAADYPDAASFQAAFLPRLEAASRKNPIMRRYLAAVRQADAQALWELGNDARHFSNNHMPGEVLAAAGDVTYIYNPDNCPEATLAWLADHPMRRRVLPDASHWPSVDQPAALSAAMLASIRA